MSVCCPLTSPTEFMNDLTHSAQSTLTNKSRLKLLHRREEHLQDLFSTTRSSITTLATDQSRYVQFQEGVILQAFLQIMEPSVTVLARKSDLAVATQASEAAAKSFKEISGRNIAFEVDASLSDDGQVPCFYCVIAFFNQMGSPFSAGGVKLISGSRRITLDNTLDERLKLLEDRVCHPLSSFHLNLIISHPCADVARDQKGPLRY